MGLFVFLGLTVLGYLLGQSAIRFKEYERTVRVKGLSEKEYPADIVLWPIQFTEAGNDLSEMYVSLDDKAGKIRGFLKDSGIEDAEITVSPPTITDKLAQRYGNPQKVKFRYTAQQAITVYSQKVKQVRGIINQLAKLGKQGIVFTEGGYRTTEYIFTRLNKVKPEMVEEATMKAREVAEKFAKDSNSFLGKIKRATQGQFSISARDRHNPHIKKIRVVSTVEYYLSD
ncbi:MAG: SIMPL domain-containing protein [Nitrospinaceae bacterium]|nr:MAG: SIMPL domain-containing protein [Nitrospinaceae bacterium]